jgi:hypothetical protein
LPKTTIVLKLVEITPTPLGGKVAATATCDLDVSGRWTGTANYTDPYSRYSSTSSLPIEIILTQSGCIVSGSVRTLNLSYVRETKLQGQIAGATLGLNGMSGSVAGGIQPFTETTIFFTISNGNYMRWVDPAQPGTNVTVIKASK